VLTAVIVPVPEASPTVDGWRERTCLDRPSNGVPAHVTLLFPFVPSDEVDERTVSELAALFEATSAFEVAFRRADRFPEVLYLAPEPAEPFVALTEALVARWPGYPPYAGAFDTVVPHLTVAHGDGAVLDAAAADIKPSLPIGSVVREALLLEEIEPDWGRWGPRARFSFGA